MEKLSRELLMRDAVLALIVGLVVCGVQIFFDHRQTNRSLAAAQAQALRAERLENLRFVRDRSVAGTQGEPLPFAGLDLEGQPLQGLYLEKANFADARMRGSALFGAHLRGSFFGRTDLRDADLDHADLRSAIFDVTDLRGADLSGADLEGAVFGPICWDSQTVWPAIRPDESARLVDCPVG